MSFVTTARLRSLPSREQISPMSEVLPVPTGPATPRRSARRGSEVAESACVAMVSGTEQPPVRAGVVIDPRLDEWCGRARDLPRVNEVGHGVDDLGTDRSRCDGPFGGLERVERIDL